VQGRVLGVDLGTRRVGLDLSDPLRMISSPLATIPMSSESELTRQIVDLCRKHEVSAVVLGLPLSANGAEGPGCQRARRIARNLASLDVATELQDESWSSRDAEDILRETGRTRKSAREKIDAIAASLILRDYLARVSGP
jgi:putative holliday junction resolvase